MPNYGDAEFAANKPLKPGDPGYCDACKGECKIPDPKPYCIESSCDKPTNVVRKHSGWRNGSIPVVKYVYVCEAGHESSYATYR